jgi:hypothetical protein
MKQAVTSIAIEMRRIILVFFQAVPEFLLELDFHSLTNSVIAAAH